ncbi:6ffb112b-b6d0-424b-b9ed-5ceac955cd36-CDS [Sclerotinia trifoliorum]|uniref:6ffb112b-b6d0-424b-b9ed-5ceac955cd36-CDS n=1 Tax=Sclerotinia trifoliorum TaxID=28548 RepID=A0A8H2ZJT3_9HELO|nr:6ffb112b-b6d0-424b-b9ed-5ceac955cd36-CDS [Sclerotinia trifoliorum]
MAQLVPFTKLEELCNDLDIVDGQIQQHKNSNEVYLPGHPRIQLHDLHGIKECLQTELMTTDLNKLAPYLWLVAKQDSQHISSLTEQIVRGRNIILTENPGLHLLWFDNRVFIKPIPKYLLSHAFWDYYLMPTNPPRIQEPVRKELIQAAYGMLRSFAILIKHESDFALATRKENQLIPDNISYASFINFIDRFQITDNQVSPRYQYGELRLMRLNFWSRIFLLRFNYHKVEWAYGAYFARYYGPILFIFGVFSLLLSAMQVVFNVLAIQGLPDPGSGSWWTFAVVSRDFSIFTLVVVAAITAFLLATFIALFARELIYALYHLHR